MVTERSAGDKADNFRRAFTGYLSKFGTSITRIRTTETKDDMNRVTATSTSSVNYSADIQWVNKYNIDHLNLGDVKIGDGMLFLEYSADVKQEDDITFSGSTWRTVEQIEGEQVQGDVVYKGFVIRKNSQTADD